MHGLSAGQVYTFISSRHDFSQLALEKGSGGWRFGDVDPTFFSAHSPHTRISHPGRARNRLGGHARPTHVRRSIGGTCIGGIKFLDALSSSSHPHIQNPDAILSRSMYFLTPGIDRQEKHVLGTPLPSITSSTRPTRLGTDLSPGFFRTTTCAIIPGLDLL